MKKRLTLILLHILFTSFASSCYLLRPNGEIKVANSKRTFTIHTPKGYPNKRTSYPVLFVFHGNPSQGWQMKLYTGMNKTADKNNFIVVYPDAIDNRWAFDNCKKVDADIQFVKKLLDYLNKKYNIDKSKIYFSGMSGGGFFLSALSNEIPEKIASMAVIASSSIDLNLCEEKELNIPIPFLLIQGTSDFLYNGIPERGILSTNQTIDKWIKRNKCDTIPIITEIPDTKKKDNSSVIKFQYLSKINKDVTFYKIKNGGHHWPNSKFNANVFTKFDLGALNRDFDTNQIIWDFVSSYKK